MINIQIIEYFSFIYYLIIFILFIESSWKYRLIFDFILTYYFSINNR